MEKCYICKTNFCYWGHMKKQIMMTAISLCSLTWAMDHKANPYYTPSYAKSFGGHGKATKCEQQPDHLKPLFNPTPRQSMEREQEANLLLPRLSGNATHNTTSLHQTSLFIVHRDRAKL